MLFIFNMVWPWFFCGTVFVCQLFPYHGNDMIFWILPIVLRHAFCMWHWAIRKDLDLSFIWGHHHLHLEGIWLIIKFSTSVNASLAFWLACCISVPSQYTYVCPYMEVNAVNVIFFFFFFFSGKSSFVDEKMDEKKKKKKKSVNCLQRNKRNYEQCRPCNNEKAIKFGMGISNSKYPLSFP